VSFRAARRAARKNSVAPDARETWHPAVARGEHESSPEIGSWRAWRHPRIPRLSTAKSPERSRRPRRDDASCSCSSLIATYECNRVSQREREREREREFYVSRRSMFTLRKKKRKKEIAQIKSRARRLECRNAPQITTNFTTDCKSFELLSVTVAQYAISVISASIEPWRSPTRHQNSVEACSYLRSRNNSCPIN